MIVHIDGLDKIRKDLELTVEVSDGKMTIWIDQMQPPCGDMMNTNHVIIDLPEEKTDEQIWLLRT